MEINMLCIKIRFRQQTKRQMSNSYITHGSINIMIIHVFSYIYFRNYSCSLYSQVTYPKYPDLQKTFDRGFCPGLVILHFVTLVNSCKRINNYLGSIQSVLIPLPNIPSSAKLAARETL